MKKAFRLIISCIAISFLAGNINSNAQILSDTSSLSLVKKGIDCIYNFRFKDADEICKKLSKTFPEHPVVYLLQGMTEYWENFPLLPTSELRSSYEKNMRRCIELCEVKNNKADDAEKLLADLSARGMLLLYYADNNLTSEVIPLATSTYQYIRRSFDFTSSYNDFYFFTGLYNYYRETYPEVYPVYNVIAFLFPKGNKVMGLRELNIVANNSILLKAEASSFLSGIYSSYENDFSKATAYSKTLYELYPENSQYLALCIKNLLLTKKYDEAEKLIISASGKFEKTNYYNAEFTILTGILHEKKYNNTKLAEEYYLKGIEELKAFGHFGNEFSAYGYFGLSRVSENTDVKHNKKAYRKLALELADFKNIDFD